MTISLINILIDELNKGFGDRQFFTANDLKTLGIFKTSQAARVALNEGKIPFIKISQRRRLVHRTALVKYLRDNFSDLDRNYNDENVLQAKSRSKIKE